MNPRRFPRLLVDGHHTAIREPDEYPSLTDRNPLGRGKSVPRIQRINQAHRRIESRRLLTYVRPPSPERLAGLRIECVHACPRINIHYAILDDRSRPCRGAIFKFL